jgi:hypothetical protein
LRRAGIGASDVAFSLIPDLGFGMCQKAKDQKIKRSILPDCLAFPYGACILAYIVLFEGRGLDEGDSTPSLSWTHQRILKFE